MTDKLLPLVPGDDAVPRVQDVVIGERLGLARPTNVRQTIEANMAELSAFGTLHAENATSAMPNGGTKFVTEYHLNEEQALLVCALSRTAKAAEVRRDLILTYTAYRRGQLGGAIDPRQMGGIMKSVVRAQIKEALTELAPQIIAAQLAADPRVAALNLISVRQLMDEAGAVSKGRNSLNRRVRNALMKLAAVGEVKGVTDCPHTGVALFPIDFAREFMRTTGNGWVRQHNAVQTGQGVIKFPARRRRRPISDQPSA